MISTTRLNWQQDRANNRPDCVIQTRWIPYAWIFVQWLGGFSRDAFATLTSARWLKLADINLIHMYEDTEIPILSDPVLNFLVRHKIRSLPARILMHFLSLTSSFNSNLYQQYATVIQMTELTFGNFFWLFLAYNFEHWPWMKNLSKLPSHLDFSLSLFLSH